MKFMVSTLAAVAALAVGSVAVAQSVHPEIMKAKLSQLNASGETGTATMLDGHKGLVVHLRLEGGPAEAQPAHIHKGTCEKLDPKPLYGLTSVVKGQSTTTVEGVKSSEFAKGQYAINVHKSTSDLKTYVACGNLSAPK